MDDLSSIRERIEGKRVVSAAGAKLLLDDGTALHLYMSDSDCCASADGEWVIQPDALDAIAVAAALVLEISAPALPGRGTFDEEWTLIEAAVLSDR